MAFQRLWSFQTSGTQKDAAAATAKSLRVILDQFGAVGEVAALSQVCAPDPKTAGAVILTTVLVYRVPAEDTAFDFEG